MRTRRTSTQSCTYRGTTSVSGIYGNIGQTNYGAAKAGIASFTTIAALELARYGVTVNAISPGYFVNTSIYRNMRGLFRLGAQLVFGIGSLFGLNTPQRSARTYVMLATDPALEKVTAGYFEHGKPKETSPLARAVAPRKRLWAWSAEQTGLDGD